MMKRTSLQFFVVFSFIIINSCVKHKRSHSAEESTTTPFTGSVIKNISYAANTNWTGQNEQLLLDVYLLRQEKNITGAKYPLLVWIHGGGFAVGDKDSTENFAALVASKGFVVAPINYRLGWTQNKKDACKGDTLQANEAIYRAIQDARAALRFLVANADKYSVDTNWIFLGGASAGAVTTLGVAYYTQQTIDYYLPHISARLGPLDEGNSLTNTYTIKGLISMWGAINSPDLINKSNAKPTIFFHGTNDKVVPFNTDHFYKCTNFPDSYGSQPLYNKLISLGVPALAQIKPGGGHGVYTDNFRANECVCFLNSLITNAPQKGYYVGEQPGCK
jgi:acetyl esterase/lipase